VSSKNLVYNSSNKDDILDFPIIKDKDGKRIIIGPSNRWENIQSHYETMNNKENFGGDVDDIEDMSENIDDNSRMNYSPEVDEYCEEVYQEEEEQEFSGILSNQSPQNFLIS
jgi:hypothetical protein